MDGTPRIADLDASARELATSSLSWMDGLYDERAALLWNPPDLEAGSPRTRHMVRESGWYALGLLARGGRGDVERASRTLEAIVDAQYDAEGCIWHGTFARAPEESHPPADAREWVHYDPNWRQFIGTTIVQVLRSHAQALPDRLVERLEQAVELAVVGEPQDRVAARYSNIALMKAWLEVELGGRRARSDLVESGETLAREIVGLFEQCDAFEEYNSPTYYAVDLWALALWRRSKSRHLRSWGESVEAALWRDVARFYHAGLRNLAGPWTRAYGMDMTRYLAGLGLWIWSAVGRDRAPVPNLDEAFAHAHDYCKGPGVALLGARIPDDVLPHLQAFRGARRVERTIGRHPQRVASAWLEERLMIGAEAHGVDLGRWDQYHPATVHWRTPDGGIGWIRLRHPARVEARADERRLELVCHDSPWAGEEATRFVVGGVTVDPKALGPDHWSLPGLEVELETDAAFEAAEPRPDGADIRYARRRDGVTRATLLFRCG